MWFFYKTNGVDNEIDEWNIIGLFKKKEDGQYLLDRYVDVRRKWVEKDQAKYYIDLI